jgi:N-acyl homoserine lactone hydrolase
VASQEQRFRTARTFPPNEQVGDPQFCRARHDQITHIGAARHISCKDYKGLDFDMLVGMIRVRNLPTIVLMLALLMAALPAGAQNLKLYVFDTGSILGIDPAGFHLTKDEVGETDMVCASYLIVHTAGGRTETLLWDSGVVADADVEAGKGEVKRGATTMKATKTLRSQLAAVGFAPNGITYFALSHMHFDHVANANAFAAGSLWLVQRPEREAMFSDKPGAATQAASYAALKDAKTKILDGSDYDVFGDGSAVIKAAYGHTPGHQVLMLKLAKTGPVVLAGDLYHYQAERGTDKVPGFEFSRDQSLASRKTIEALVKQSGAQLWIEHDMAHFRTQKKSPQFYD